MISKKELKLIKSLKIKKYRSLHGKFLVEGFKNVEELLKSDFEVDNLFCTKEYESHFKNFPFITLSGEQLNTISTLSNNQACLAVAKIRPFTQDEIDLSDHVIVLEGVRDPGNLGTVIRTLDWFGFSQVVCSEDCADFYNPKTIAASMGSFTRIKPIYLDLIPFLNSTEHDSYALTLDGKPLPENDFKRKGIFILGSESHGVSGPIAAQSQHHLTVPGVGNAESLNVAMATGILLYQLRFGK